MKRLTTLAVALLAAAISSTYAQQVPAPPTAPEAPKACSFLGIYPDNFTAGMAQELGLDGAYGGAIVTGVVPNTGAERAGLKEKDVIVQFNGANVSGEQELRKLIFATAPGTMVPLGIVRDGRPMTVSAEITKLPGVRGNCGCNCEQKIEIERNMEEIEKQLRDSGKDMELSDGQVRQFRFDARDIEKQLRDAQQELRKSMIEIQREGNRVGGNDGAIGLQLQNLTPQLAKYFKVADAKGVLVSDVRENSPGANAGIRAGDVIVAVNGQKVAGPLEVIRSAHKADGAAIELRIVRDGQEQTITLPGRASQPVVPAPEPQQQNHDNGSIGSPDIGMLTAPEKEIRIVRTTSGE